MNPDALLARRDRVLGAGAPLFYDRPLHLVRGEGTYLFDADGRRYVDMYNNVPCVGHGNPAVASAVARQQATLNVHSRYLHEGIVEFAERLVGLHGDRIESAIFSCTGTEAIEIALKMAAAATGSGGVIATNATYHGNSETVAALHRAPNQQADYPWVRNMPFPDMFRPLSPNLDEAQLADAHLDLLQQAIDELRESEVGFSAVVFCSLFANEGLPDIPTGFMARASEMVRAAGGIVIADEVQAGYARTGQWWGYGVTGLDPDVVVTGKPMGNGVPLSATVASRELVERFRERTGYFNTFASSPLQAAAGNAVLDEIVEHDLHDRVTRAGTVLYEALLDRADSRPWIGDVRGRGTFLAVEMVDENDLTTPDAGRAIDVMNRLKDRGFLTANAGAYDNVLKIRPPLVFDSRDADAFIVAFDEVLADIGG